LLGLCLGLLKMLNLDLLKILLPDRGSRRRGLNTDGCRGAVASKLDRIAVVELRGIYSKPVYDRAVRAGIVADVETVGPRFDECVLFRGDPFAPRVKSYAAGLAPSYREEARLEFEGLPIERTAGDRQPQFHTAIIGTKSRKS